MRTQAEIDSMIAHLEALKALVPPRTLLDEDTIEAIDSQIKVLRDKFNENDVWNQWPSGSEDAYNRDRAMLVLSWLEGNDGTLNPAINWQRLRKGLEQ